MSTLEDKIMGEKLQYYCSSSEDEKEEESGDEEAGENKAAAAQPAPDMTKDMTHWQGNSANTGPKGKPSTFLTQN